MSTSDEVSTPRGPRRISGSVLYRLHQCERRLWLDSHRPELAASRTAHDDAVRERGVRLEADVARGFGDLVEPMQRDGLRLEDAASEALEHLCVTRRPMQQPVLMSADGRRVSTPDFVYWDGDTLVIHEAKLVLRPERRPDIALQMTHAAAIAYEHTGAPITRLVVTNGNHEIISITPLSPEAYATAIARAEALVTNAPEPDILLAHSVCEHCPFYAHCWAQAEQEGRIETLSEVWRARGDALHAMGIRTVGELAALRPEHLLDPVLRKSANRILAEARAHHTRAAVWLQAPRMPTHRTPVWFDLEGEAMGEAADIPIYLWGLAVEAPEGAQQAETILADLEPGGDLRAWERFVARAMRVMDEHPDAVWVHWHDAEVMWIKRYLKRHGAPDRFAAHMLKPGTMFDLHRAVDQSLRLPVRGYSVKKVAGFVGFEWSNPEAGSQWSVERFERARATTDTAERERIMADLAQYNADDLWAMRAIWHWMMSHAPKS
ncbi:MAG: TM0106 family RecB-like putative nuclease [Candidatus Eisenbacteria bacterium]